MSNRDRRGASSRLLHRAAIITGAAATSLALLTGPAHAAPAAGTCFAFSPNTPASGVNISFPTVQLASGTTMRLTVVTQTGAQPEAAGIYFWDGTSAYWQQRLPEEIFGGEWRNTPMRVNDPMEVAASVPGYRLTLTAWFKKEYFDTTGRLTGTEDNVPIRMADGSPCHS